MKQLIKKLSRELNRYEKAEVTYDNTLDAVIINGDAIQIFATMIHINPSYSSFKLNEKAFNLIKEIQREL